MVAATDLATPLAECRIKKQTFLTRIRELHDELKVNEDRYKQSVLDLVALDVDKRAIVANEVADLSQYRDYLELMNDMADKMVQNRLARRAMETELRQLETEIPNLDTQITILEREEARKVIFLEKYRCQSTD